MFNTLNQYTFPTTNTLSFSPTNPPVPLLPASVAEHFLLSLCLYLSPLFSILNNGVFNVRRNVFEELIPEQGLYRILGIAHELKKEHVHVEDDQPVQRP